MPQGKAIIPGVLDSTTNFIEHPELVVQHLERDASVVGREHVIAGTDCGFATFAGLLTVDPDITWASWLRWSTERGPQRIDGGSSLMGQLWVDEKVVRKHMGVEKPASPSLPYK